jgi:hypothetical protein
VNDGGRKTYFSPLGDDRGDVVDATQPIILSFFYLCNKMFCILSLHVCWNFSHCFDLYQKTKLTDFPIVYSRPRFVFPRPKNVPKIPANKCAGTMDLVRLFLVVIYPFVLHLNYL